MAKKLVAENELSAKEAEFQGTEKREKEVFESEADSISIEDIKSSSRAVEADPADFDWDADEKMFGNYNQTDRAQMEEMYAGTFNSVEKGEIISGVVVTINSKDVVLNIGFKSDGLVPVNEFRDTPDLKIYYGRKVNEEKKNKMCVINAIRNKLILRVFACVNQNKEYEINYQKLVA